MNQLSHFEENLLTELRGVVAAQAAPPRPARPRRRLALATAGAGLVAAGVVVGVPAMTGDKGPAAYAVTSDGDGWVSVLVRRLEDPDGLERELAAHGINAEVDFLPAGKVCQSTPERFPGNPHPLPDSWGGVIHTGAVPGAHDIDLVMPIDEAVGKTLVLIARSSDYPDMVIEQATYLVSGPVGPCVVVDEPPR